MTFVQDVKVSRGKILDKIRAGVKARSNASTAKRLQKAFIKIALYYRK